MAATEIVVQSGGFQTTRTLTYVASQLEMTFINDGYTVLFVKNGSGGAVVVTFTPVKDNAGRTKIIIPEVSPVNEVDPAWTLADGANATFGPFRPIWWNKGGYVNVAFDVADADILVAAVKFQF
jgi:hypothetical protein